MYDSWVSAEMSAERIWERICLVPALPKDTHDKKLAFALLRYNIFLAASLF